MTTLPSSPDVPTGLITQLSLAALDPQTRELTHRYFHTTWRHQYPPYGYCAFYLEAYDPRSKMFSIRVLSDGRVLNHIPLDYPCVIITEVEAEVMTAHRRGNQTTKQPNNIIMSEENSGAPVAPVKQRTSADGRPSLRSLACKGFVEGLDQDTIVKAIQVVYPEKPEAKIRQLVSLYRWNEKAKAKKQAALALAPDATPAAEAPAAE